MNPTGQPFPDPYGNTQPPAGNGGARDAVNVPSIIMIIFGALTELSGLFSLVTRGNPADNPQLQQMLTDPNMPEGVKSFVLAMTGPVGTALNVFSLLVGGLLIFAGIQMRNLKLWPVAVIGAVAMLLPGTCCCCITLPIGIWTLVVLMRDEVKSAFS